MVGNKDRLYLGPTATWLSLWLADEAPFLVAIDLTAARDGGSDWVHLGMLGWSENEEKSN